MVGGTRLVCAAREGDRALAAILAYVYFPRVLRLLLAAITWPWCYMFMSLGGIISRRRCNALGSTSETGDERMLRQWNELMDANPAVSSVFVTCNSLCALRALHVALLRDFSAYLVLSRQGGRPSFAHPSLSLPADGDVGGEWAMCMRVLVASGTRCKSSSTS